MYVSWDSFEDVEEFQTIAHTFGIQNYELGIGACLIYLRFNTKCTKLFLPTRTKKVSIVNFHSCCVYLQDIQFASLLSIYKILPLMTQGCLR